MINDKQWLCEVDAWDPNLPTAENSTMTFNRASVAYDPVTGASIPGGIPRYSATGPLGGCVFMENGTTNLATNSDGSSTTGWTAIGSGTLSTAAIAEAVKPPGMTNRIKMTLTGTTCRVGQVINLTLNTVYTLSFWCYVPSSVAAGRAVCTLSYYNGSTYVQIGSSTTITERDVWVEKVIPAFTSNATYAQHYVALDLLTSVAGDYLYVTKFQLELGNFRTTWTPGVRNSELLSFATAGKLSMAQGTVEYWACPWSLMGSTHLLFYMLTGTNRRFLLFHRGTGQIGFDHGDTSVSLTSDLGVMAVGRWTHIAARWSTTSGTRELFVNGIQVASMAYAPGTDAWPTNCNIISSSGGEYLSNIRVSNVALTDREINQSFTTSGVVLPRLSSTTLLIPLITDTKNYTITTGGIKTLRFCSGTNYVDRTTKQSYQSRIVSPALYRSTIFDNKAGGASSAGFGEIRLANADGKLDALYDYSFDGRAVRITESNLGTVTAYMNCIVEKVQFNMAEVTLILNSNQALLDTVIQANTYGGTSTGATGIDGGEEVKGVKKPRVIGSRVNFWTPVCANPTKLIYQYNDTTLLPNLTMNAPGVYDKGVLYTIIGADYTSQVDMETNQPDTGGIRFWPAGGCFRLQAPPTKLTCMGITSYSVAATIRELIISALGSSAWSWGAGYPAFLTGSSYAVYAGLSLTTETYAQALDKLFGVGPGWWGFDSNGAFICGDLTASLALSPTIAITDRDIVTIDLQDAEIPAWKVIVKYRKNYSVHGSGDFAAGLTEPMMTPLKSDWRTVEVSSAAIKTAHPTATELTFESTIYGASAWVNTDTEASAFASRLFALYSVTRRKIIVTVAFNAAEHSAIYLGCAVRLLMSRYGLINGKTYVVMGRQDDARRGLLTLTLWG